MNMSEERDLNQSALERHTTEELLQSHRAYRAALTLWQVIPPVILATGTVGNLLSLVIFGRIRRDSYSLSSAAYGSTSSSCSSVAMTYFFSALSVSDLLLMYTGLLRRWLVYVVGFDMRRVHTTTCRLHTFLVYLTSMTSAWFLVAMTLQRVTSVLWPHRVQLMCTRRSAKVTIGVILLLLTAINFPLLLVPFDAELDTVDMGDNTSVTSAPELADSDCSIPESSEWSYFYNFVFMWEDLVVSSLLPSILLILGNGVLGLSLARSVRQARQISTAGGGLQSGQRQRNRRRVASSLTVTLMCLSVTYLLLTLPVCLYFLLEGYHVFVSGDDVTSDSHEAVLLAVTNLLWYANAALNFYVYVLTGTRFRAQCLRTVCPCRPPASRYAHAQSHTSEAFAVSMAAGRAVSFVAHDLDSPMGSGRTLWPSKLRTISERGSVQLQICETDVF